VPASTQIIAIPIANCAPRILRFDAEAAWGVQLQYVSMAQKSDEDWKKTLTPEQFHVLREHGTERAGTSPLNREKRDGTFTCAGCGSPLFPADTKFESGTGWPSFSKPIDGATETTTDRSYGMTRVEVHCAKCGGHLGHVFPDGPKPTGERYCMNGVALDFEPK
jgi:peptide-methionine (R)-S-oxide reductase